MKFDEVIGQEDAKRRLVQMVKENRLPHAMMLCGPEGSGKMALAMAFASYLLCCKHENSDEACGECQQCHMLRTWEHPDLHFSFPVIRPAGTSAEHKMKSDDFAKEWHEMISGGAYFNMAQWLEQMKAANQQAQIFVGESDDLSRKLSMKSSQGGYKINIMWLAERMNAECANKMLKILEEPPQQTIFIMVCEDTDRMLETIKSRTQRIDIKRIEDKDIEEALVNKRGIGAEDAARIAHIANGSWMKALEALNADNENSVYFDMFVRLMRLAYARNIKELKAWSEAAAAYGREKQKGMLLYFSKMTRENFMYNFHSPELNYMTTDEENFAKKFAPFINEANVIEIYELIAKALRDIVQNANGKIVFFDMAVQMIELLIKK